MVNFIKIHVSLFIKSLIVISGILVLAIIIYSAAVHQGSYAVQNSQTKLLIPDSHFTPHFQDSDGGFNFSIKGRRLQKEDRCSYGVVPGIGHVEGLIETVCFNNSCHEFFITPPVDYSCEDGRLVKTPQLLVDSDGGVNIFSQGITFRDGQILESTADYCENEKNIKEYSVGSNFIYQCPEGTFCKDGACQGASVSCKEIIPKTNQPDDKRFNLVFVGSDYHLIDPDNYQKGLDAFLWDIKALLGENTNAGFFDFEPFKSNRKNFNLWYVDRFNVMAPVIEPYDNEVHQKRNSDSMVNARVLAAKCKVDYDLQNVIVVHLVPNKGTLDSGITIATTRHVQLFNKEEYKKCQRVVKRAISLLPDSDRNGCVDVLPQSAALSTIDYNGDGNFADQADKRLFDRLLKISSIMSLCKKQKDSDSVVENLCASGLDNLGRTIDHGSTLAHEFGHKFQLFDTGVTKADQYPQWDGVTIGNCFIAQSKSACLANAPWKLLLGNGCGRDKVSDCSTRNPLYDLEVGCFEGCIGGVSSFRPERASTYTYGFAIPKGSRGSDQLGLWNEWYLMQVMRAYLEL